MHDCPCCGEAVYSDDMLCDACEEAGCEPNGEDVFDDCQIPECPECETRASLMSDGHWHDNCEDDCERVLREGHTNWPGRRASKENATSEPPRDVCPECGKDRTNMSPMVRGFHPGAC